MGKVIIGIDPGLSGAIGVYSDALVEVYDMPTLTIEGTRKRSGKTGKMVDKKKNVYDIAVLNNMIKTLSSRALDGDHSVEVWLEKSQAMPDQGGVSNFNYGMGFGILQAVVTCNKIPLTLIHPVTWKKAIMFGMGKEKDAAVYRAQQLFPNLEFKGPRGGLLDGRAEAMLIAYYGYKYSSSI